MSKSKEVVFMITLICFLLGLMVTMQLKTVKKNNDSIVATRSTEIQAQYSELKKSYDELNETLVEKEKTIQDYRNAGTNDATNNLLMQELKNAQRDAGLTDVRGQGIIVQMDDSKADYGAVTDLNNYLVHDEDILKVINELKSSGAEAIAVNDQRIVATSEVRCAGTTILINGERLAAPYIIKAIGDSATLENALTMRGGQIDLLDDWIKFTITKEPDVFIPKYTKKFATKFLNIVEVQ